MINKRKQFGLTLVELIAVVAAIALMIGLAIPAVKSFNAAMSSSAGVESVISATLASGRALAAKHQKYAGIRFQQDKDGNQYMIPIIYDDAVGNGVAGNLGMMAIKGLNPIRLPDDLGVFDLKNSSDGDVSTGIDSSFDDCSTFSILFSPAGNLVIHQHWVKKNPAAGVEDSVSNSSYDNGMFLEDTARELSRSFIVIYEKKKYNEAANKWNDYLDDLPVLYINPYTGSVITSQTN